MKSKIANTVVITVLFGQQVGALRPLLPTISHLAPTTQLTPHLCQSLRHPRCIYLYESLNGSVDVQGPSNAPDKVEKSGIFVTEEQQNQNFLSESHVLTQAAAIGIFSGFVVALFKLSVDFVRRLMYGAPLLTGQPLIVLALIPAIGGVAVGLLTLAGDFSPGLKGSVKEVDEESDTDSNEITKENSFRPLRFLRKSAAAVCTLGSGCSLGPEGPSVELGLNLSRILMTLFPLGRNDDRAKAMQRNRLLLSCGAAAGVSAGFNAPLAGVFFALEIVQGVISSVHKEDGRTSKVTDNLTAGSATITAILLASVLSGLVCKAVLGEHLVLKLAEYSLKTPLIELPLYLLLGAMSGVVAFMFSQTAKLSQSFFDGKLGPQPMRDVIGPLPKWIKPILGGLFCGLVGLQFPQILFFGYETLNSLLANSSLPTNLMLSLLLVKLVTTAVSAGSGLVSQKPIINLWYGDTFSQKNLISPLSMLD
jgi:H+/Cl- antiporter ClcA